MIICIVISAKFGQDENLIRNLLKNFWMELPVELTELVEELPKLVDPKMTRQNDITTSKLLEVLKS
jgi:hypothetical protein